MASFNRVILLGNLTKDPELRYMKNNDATALCSFSLALNRKYKQGDETKEEVNYFDVVVYGKMAENCGTYLKKGSSVLIDGRLRQSRWEDHDSGQKRSKVDVVAENVTFMPRKEKAPGEEGDIPF